MPRRMPQLIRVRDLPPWVQSPLQENARVIFEDALNDIYGSPDYLSLEQWCEQYRTLPQDAAESGRMRMDRTPYMKGIAAALDSTDPSQQIVVVQKGSQLGFSELAVSYIGKTIHQSPVSIMFLQETEQKVKRTMKARVLPMLRTTPFRGILDTKDLTRTEVAYPGGFLTLWGSNSASSFSSTTAAVLILDEFARYPVNVRNEGDPLTLAEARIATFGSRGKIYIPSTPVDEDGEEGSFASVYRMGDCREFFVPCPSCGHMDYLRRDRFVATDDEHGVRGRIACHNCGELFEEQENKREMMARGEWRPTKERDSFNITSFNCPGLLAPLGWMSWTSIAQKYLNALRGKMSMRPVYNTCFGEPYTEQIERPRDNLQEKFGQERERGVVPDNVAYLTMAVDMQRGWMKWEVKGWRENDCSSSIEQGKIKYDISSKEGKVALREIIRKRWPTLRGGWLPIEIVAVDSGDGHTTAEVYKFASAFPQPVGTKGGWAVVSPRSVIATKGGHQLDPENIIVRSTPLRRRVGMQREIRLWVMGTPIAKMQLYKALNYNAEDDGEYARVDYPKSYEKQWWKELISEPILIRRHATSGKALVVFGKPEGRNEALDLHVMNRAAAEVYGCSQLTPKMMQRLRRRGDATDAKKRAADKALPKQKRQRDSIDKTAAEVPNKIPEKAVAKRKPRRRKTERQYI